MMTKSGLEQTVNGSSSGMIASDVACGAGNASSVTEALPAAEVQQSTSAQPTLPQASAPPEQSTAPSAAASEAQQPSGDYQSWLLVSSPLLSQQSHRMPAA